MIHSPFPLRIGNGHSCIVMERRDLQTKTSDADLTPGWVKKEIFPVGEA